MGSSVNQEARSISAHMPSPGTRPQRSATRFTRYRPHPDDPRKPASVTAGTGRDDLADLGTKRLRHPPAPEAGAELLRAVRPPTAEPALEGRPLPPDAQAVPRPPRAG